MKKIVILHTRHQKSKFIEEIPKKTKYFQYNQHKTSCMLDSLFLFGPNTRITT